MYEGIRTLRCGALCVHPDYRGSEISHRLFDLHKSTALKEGCRQMFLEVIAGNDRALRFYEKKGYEKMYDIAYYSHSNPMEFDEALPESVTVERIAMASLREFGKNSNGVHVNWQNDFDYRKLSRKPTTLVVGMKVYLDIKTNPVSISNEHDTGFLIILLYQLRTNYMQSTPVISLNCSAVILPFSTAVLHCSIVAIPNGYANRSQSYISHHLQH